MRFSSHRPWLFMCPTFKFSIHAPPASHQHPGCPTASTKVVSTDMPSPKFSDVGCHPVAVAASSSMCRCSAPGAVCTLSLQRFAELASSISAPLAVFASSGAPVVETGGRHRGACPYKYVVIIFKATSGKWANHHGKGNATPLPRSCRNSFPSSFPSSLVPPPFSRCSKQSSRWSRKVLCRRLPRQPGSPGCGALCCCAPSPTPALQQPSRCHSSLHRPAGLSPPIMALQVVPPQRSDDSASNQGDSAEDMSDESVSVPSQSTTPIRDSVAADFDNRDSWVAPQDMAILQAQGAEPGFKSRGGLRQSRLRRLPRGTRPVKLVGEGAANAVFELKIPRRSCSDSGFTGSIFSLFPELTSPDMVQACS